MSEPRSDPGLCAAVTDKLNDSLSLIEFGKDEKCTVLTKYDVFHWLTGSEYISKNTETPEWV